MVLLVPDGKTENDYKQWGEEIGLPSELGVHMQVGISYSDQPGPPHVVVEGIVGVPRPPEDDFERSMLANKLADLVECPDIAIFQFTGQIWWRIVHGGPFKVKLIKSTTLRELDESEISNSVSFSGPGPLNEPVFQAEFAESIGWEHEYRANRYLRFESRTNLNRRYQDLITNITILNDTGQVSLTAEKHWHQLFKHVVVEMFIRGEPPVPHNFDPIVEKAILFPDKDLCKQAADAVGSIKISGPILVKYGKADYIKALFEHGEIFMLPASSYRNPKYNQAVRDQELSLLHYVAVTNGSEYLKEKQVCANPNVLKAPENRILPLFHASDAKVDEVTRVESFGPDGWVYCLSNLLTPRLFTDFNADACVILNHEEFEKRICDALRTQSGNRLFGHGRLQYIDPLGAYTELPSRPNMHLCYGADEVAEETRFSPFGPKGELFRPPEVHFQKTFRFAYQREYRFLSYPRQFTKQLDAPLKLALGPLRDIGDLIVL